MVSDDNERVSGQLHHPSDRGVLTRTFRHAQRDAARALQRVLARPVATGTIRLQTALLADLRSQWSELPARVSVVYVSTEGAITGEVLLVCSPTLAQDLVRASHTPNSRSSEHNPEDIHGSFERIGVTFLHAYLESLTATTHLSARTSAPLTAHNSSLSALDLALAHAGRLNRFIVACTSTFAVRGGTGAVALRAPLYLMFLPTGNTVAAIVDVLDDNRPQHACCIPVRMGEMAVSRRTGDVLTAEDIGACIAVALIDQRAGVGALAHVMLPDAEYSQAQVGLSGIDARFADVAVPALVAAVERAGGRRDRATAFVAGGGLLLTGSRERISDIPVRTLDAVKSSLSMLDIPLVAQETGGTSSRTMAVHINDMRVVVSTDHGMTHRLDAA